MAAATVNVIAVDVENKKLYELFYARWMAAGGMHHPVLYSILNSNTMRPETWTSADAFGLPIFPGLVRYEEILKGAIDHPIRFPFWPAVMREARLYLSKT